jgi:hypothetical protein
MTNTDCTRRDQDRETAELVSKPETANINNRRAKSPRERLIAKNSRTADNENRPGNLVHDFSSVS